MAKKFISVLGISNYSKCKYGSNEKFVETRFIQEAILDLYFGNYNPEDEIVIFLTKEAEKKNWRDRVETNKYNGLKDILMNTSLSNEKKEQIRELVTDTEWNGYETSNTLEGLKSILNEKYKCRIKTITIEDGKTEEEIWSIFEKIYNSFNEGDEVIFDITHGLRSIPMLALTVLNYAKVIKNIKISGIYYGAYEAKSIETSIAPIFDLASYNDILEWTSAINLFINYGNGYAIYDLYNSLKKCKARKNDKTLFNSELGNFVKYVNRFSKCIQTSRGRLYRKCDEIDKPTDRSKKCIYEAAINIKESLEKLKNEDTTKVKPLEPLLKKIEEGIVGFYDKDNLSIGLSTMNWCIKYGLIQQGYTAFEETLKTYLCNKYKLSEYGKETRDYIVKDVLNKLKTKKYIENECEYKSEIYRRIEKTVPDDIVELSKMSNLRNDISHFGFTKEFLDYESLEKNLKKCKEKMLEIIKKYENDDFTKIIR